MRVLGCIVNYSSRYHFHAAARRVTYRYINIGMMIWIKQKETAEKVPSALEKGGFRRIYELKSLSTPLQKRQKLRKRNSFSALSESYPLKA